MKTLTIEEMEGIHGGDLGITLAGAILFVVTSWDDAVKGLAEGLADGSLGNKFTESKDSLR